MSRSKVRLRRRDPYKNFRFKIKLDGRYVAGVSCVSGLKRSTEVVEQREGCDLSATRKVPGRTSYEAIMLERGLTHDIEFEKWARAASAGEADFRKDIIIDIFNEAGKKVVSYKVMRCWVSAYQVLPNLDPRAKAIAIESLKVENEGWERDTASVETQDCKGILAIAAPDRILSRRCTSSKSNSGSAAHPKVPIPVRALTRLGPGRE